MGEMRYITNNGKRVIFDEESDYGCLCTFPHNNEVMGNIISKGTVASLALLGASIAIAANKPESMINQDTYDGYYYLPNCVPEWIRKGIEDSLGIVRTVFICDKCKDRLEFEDYFQNENGSIKEIWLCPKCNEKVEISYEETNEQIDL